MEDLLTPSVRKNLSEYELALLLLAAYGHDIGMTPERGKVIAHHRHLFAPEGKALTGEEKEAFRRFLDDQSEGPVALPLSASLEDLDRADELVAFYVRDRHNDWSANWLRENLVVSSDGFASLPNVLETVVVLCSSHHWNFSDLDTKRFDPFIVGSGPEARLIHLRFLACILRLADILENDPKRTPEILFQHRAIKDRPRSVEHWWKDHDLSISERGTYLNFQARPRNAKVHRALIQLADWIDHELHGIAAISHRLPAEYKLGKQSIHRDWHLGPSLTRDIRPFDDSYEYIDGAFRPNTPRLLQLLSGEQLYGNPLHSVRELLQNAFDAVREKIARKRLEPHITNPADAKWDEILGNQEHVTLTLRRGPNSQWQLICEDSGVGLTKDIIKNHVLVSGSSRRHSILELERRCREKGFRPGLTGQFGIGVLSYFILADEVTLETTRFQGCSDGVENWQFTTRGVGSFGELRKTGSGFPSGGTRITWGLRRDRIEDPINPGYIGTLGLDLLFYLQDTLLRVPCRFTLRREEVPGHVNEWSCETGWVKNKNNLMAFVMSEWEDEERVTRGEVYLAAEERAEFHERRNRYPVELAKARESLCCESLEISLPGDVGTARINLFFFELEKGRSLTFRPEDLRSSFLIDVKKVYAWKGMKLSGVVADLDEIEEFEDPLFKFAYLEIDLTSADRSLLAISRSDAIMPGIQKAEWLKYIKLKSISWIDAVLAGGSGNFYREVNLSSQRRSLTLMEECGWLHRSHILQFKPLKRPFALALQGNLVSSSGLMNIDGESVGEIFVRSGDLGILPGGCEIRVRKKLGTGLNDEIYFYWAGLDVAPRASVFDFPAEWRNVGALRFRILGLSHPEGLAVGLVPNSKNPIMSLLAEGAKANLQYSEGSGFEFWDVLDRVSTAADAASAFFRFVINILDQRGVPDRWGNYKRERADHLKFLWQMIVRATGVKLEDMCLILTDGQYEVLLSPDACVLYDNENIGNSLLPPLTDSRFLLYRFRGPATNPESQ